MIHKEHKGRYFAYSPYVREMNIWLKYVDEVEVIAPLPPKGERPPNPQRGSITGEAYNHSDLKFTTIPSFNLLSFSAIIKAIVKIPVIFLRILRVMQMAGHIHLRCPGNIGLLACICQIFFPRKPKTAKYAGNWDPDAKQPWTYKLQRWILSNTFLTRNMTVLVYGEWRNQSKNILPFFTASFSESDIEKIEKDFSAPFKFLFVGNLVPGKQPLFAIELVLALNAKNINAELHVYGDGELMKALEQAGNNTFIHLHGNQPLHVLKEAYKESHFLVLASKSEGWPKAVAEAMFFGCIPIISNVSCLSWMLNNGSRGILAPPAPEGGAYTQMWVEEIVNEVRKLIKNPEKMKRMSLEAQEWSQQYTLEKFDVAIKDILKR